MDQIRRVKAAWVELGPRQWLSLPSADLNAAMGEEAMARPTSMPIHRPVHGCRLAEFSGAAWTGQRVLDECRQTV
jgi:hypothetical protein